MVQLQQLEQEAERFYRWASQRDGPEVEGDFGGLCVYEVDKFIASIEFEKTRFVGRHEDLHDMMSAAVDGDFSGFMVEPSAADRAAYEAMKRGAPLTFRGANTKHHWQGLTPEQQDERMAPAHEGRDKAWDGLTPGQRDELMAPAHEGRDKAWDGLTAEQRVERMAPAHESWHRLTEEEKDERMAPAHQAPKIHKLFRNGTSVYQTLPMDGVKQLFNGDPAQLNQLATKEGVMKVMVSATLNGQPLQLLAGAGVISRSLRLSRSGTRNVARLLMTGTTVCNIADVQFSRAVFTPPVFDPRKEQHVQLQYSVPLRAAASAGHVAAAAGPASAGDGRRGRQGSGKASILPGQQVMHRYWGSKDGSSSQGSAAGLAAAATGPAAAAAGLAAAAAGPASAGGGAAAGDGRGGRQGSGNATQAAGSIQCAAATVATAAAAATVATAAAAAAAAAAAGAAGLQLPSAGGQAATAASGAEEQQQPQHDVIMLLESTDDEGDEQQEQQQQLWQGTGPADDPQPQPPLPEEQPDG